MDHNFRSSTVANSDVEERSLPTRTPSTTGTIQEATPNTPKIVVGNYFEME